MSVSLQTALRSLLIAALLVPLAAGCGAGAPAAAMRGQGQQGHIAALAAKLPERPTFEQAYQAARAWAEDASAGPVLPLLAAGAGLRPDGTLFSPEELRILPGLADHGGEPGWRFNFIPEREARQTQRHGVAVKVHFDGAVGIQRYDIRDSRQQPGLALPHPVTLEREIALARADGLPGQVFGINFTQPAARFGGRMYSGPLLLKVSAVPRNGEPGSATSGSFRLVQVKMGRIFRLPSSAEIRALKPTMERVVGLWFQTLSGSLDDPLTEADLVRVGRSPDRARAIVQGLDRDGDGKVSFAEFAARYASDGFIAAYRYSGIQFQFYVADQDRDERLTSAEAARAAFRIGSVSLVSISRDAPDQASVGLAAPQDMAWPLGITQAEFTAADRDGDSRLDADEYVPLGASKSLDKMLHDPDLVRELLRHWIDEAVPWSH